MRQFLIKLILFVSIPLVAGELMGRIMGPNWYGHWYEAQAPAIRESKQNYLLLGSSRVAAAIDEKGFATAMQGLKGEYRPAFNLGLGYTTLAEDYLGLRWISNSRTGGLSGCTVLVEAPRGIPSWDTWEDSWIVSSAPGPLLPYIAFRDFGRFLLHSNTPLADKIFVVSSKIFKSPETVARLRARLESTIENLSQHILSGQRELSGALPTVDLVNKGGIRTDAYGAELVRQLALEQSGQTLAGQQPVTEEIWNRSVFKSIVSLVEENGGCVVAFEMPLSSKQQAPLTTPQRLADRKVFRCLAEIWKVPVLAVPIKLSDADFPDLWHLSKTRSLEYSQRLALSLAEHEESGEIPKR